MASSSSNLTEDLNVEFLKKCMEILSAPPHLKDDQDISFVIEKTASAVPKILKMLLCTKETFSLNVPLEKILEVYTASLNDKEKDSLPFLSDILRGQKKYKKFYECIMFLLKEKFERISGVGSSTVTLIWEYMSRIVLEVLKDETANYPMLQNYSNGVARIVLEKKEEGIALVEEYLEKEKTLKFRTLNLEREYVEILEKLKKDEEGLKKEIGDGKQSVDASEVDAAFEKFVVVKAYWQIVKKRLVDSMWVHIYYTLDKLVETELSGVITAEFSKILTESENGEALVVKSLQLDQLKEELKKLRERLDEQTAGGDDEKTAGGDEEKTAGGDEADDDK